MGKSSAGNRSTPSLVQATRPTTSSAPMTISMNSGRRMAMFVSDMRLAPQVRPRSTRERRAQFDLRGDDVAVRQVVEAAGRYQLAVVDATRDFAEAVALQTHLDRLTMDAPSWIDGDH